MARAPFIVIDGRLYRWKDILELRRAQLAAAGAAQASQLALFVTLTAAHPPSARHRGAICNRACSKIRCPLEPPMSDARTRAAPCIISRLMSHAGCSKARMTFSPLAAHACPKEFGMVAVNIAVSSGL
jgi:hypothetical protein